MNKALQDQLKVILPEDLKTAVIVIKDSKVNLIQPPPSGFGEQVICWQNGKPTHVKHQYSTKF